MKDRWCAYFSAGKCLVPDGVDVPTLAVETTEITDGFEETILTDRNSILNCLWFFDPEKAESNKVPKSIVVRVPVREFRKYLSCSARNCRSKQRNCSGYK